MSKCLIQTKPLTLDENSLIQIHQPFIQSVVCHYIKKFWTPSRGYLFEDIQSEATLAFLRFCRKEQIETAKLTERQTYLAKLYMESAMRIAIWKMLNASKSAFQSDLSWRPTFTNVEAASGCNMGDNERLSSREEISEEEFLMDMEQLLGKDYEIASGLMHGERIRDIAERLDLSSRTIHRRVLQIQKKLKTYYAVKAA